MAIVDAYSGLFSFGQHGKFGLPNGFGRLMFGWSKFGYGEEKAGYYQKRKLKSGGGHCRLRHYWPKNPQTVAQQAHRQKFANAVLAWHGLTDEAKALYNRKGDNVGVEGFNYFISKYIKTH
jgi:hypothetical protein